MPIALLAGRYLRSDPRWFRIHAIFNTVTTLLIILVFGLGMGAVGSLDLGTQFNGPYSDLHHKLGLFVFIIVLVQAILGVAAHGTTRKHFLRRLHVPFGILVAGFLYWETWEGMHNEWAEMSTSLTVTPQGVQVVFWVLFLISVTAYLVAVGQVALDRVAGKASKIQGGAGGEMEAK